MSVDLETLAKQYKGAKFAELILEHVKASSPASTQSAMAGLMDELPNHLSTPVMELIDFLVQLPQQHQREFFGGDCGQKFLDTLQVTRGFMRKQHNIEINDDDNFTVFNIIVQNYVYACHINPTTKAAMQKAAGVGLLGRMFSR
ncbi:hypothetical protein [Leisingera daeponensis]|uniref:hypothetical protein n=1 Tax=Leisingera daeponensis TaxID=405746 RepID=UPI001C97CFE0|nr:hypothetical protein [Leisingera daeponensis]MBY6057259.1 hypothetical protein [Leisingera daeponensis]